MLYTEFYRQNKELIDTHLLPITNGYSMNIHGGKPAIMYQKWAWELATKMQESGCLAVQNRPIYTYETENGETYKAYNYSIMSLRFGLLGKLIHSKVLKDV
jgi:hypothetical protein